MEPLDLGRNVRGNDHLGFAGAAFERRAHFAPPQAPAFFGRERDGRSGQYGFHEFLLSLGLSQFTLAVL
jgi:hypothetical protein